MGSWEARKDLKKWRYVLYSQTGRLNNVKIFVLPKLIHGSNTIPTVIPPDFL